MADYDPKIIQKFADRLYAQARTILITYSLGIGFLSVCMFYAIRIMLHQNLVNNLVAFLIGAIMGLFYAMEKAFDLRLKAQTALCQVKIEENTRK